MSEKALRSKAESAGRVLRQKKEVVSFLADPNTKTRVKEVVKPNSVSKTLGKAGVALLLSPDPITDVPGAIMLGASLAMKRSDPLSASSVYAEARKLMSELGSLG